MTTYRTPQSHPYGSQGTPDATESDPTIKKLLGPDGKTIRTFSDRPPVGFHDGFSSAVS